MTIASLIFINLVVLTCIITISKIKDNLTTCVAAGFGTPKLLEDARKLRNVRFALLLVQGYLMGFGVAVIIAL